MILKFILVVLSTVTPTMGQTAIMNEFLLRFQQLFPWHNSSNFWNQPTSISSAPLKTPTVTIKPTVEQLWYYSYYAAVNCPTFLFHFNCTSCKQIKDDISEYKRKYALQFIDSKII